MTLGLIGVMFVGQDAMAQSAKRQVHQHKRIHHGVRNGSLTHREAKMLKMQQMHIRSMKQLAKADGRVTRGERVIINRAQKRANRNIYHKKHNARQRRY